MVYYNEIDPFAASWIRSLVSEGHIAPGDVDEQDIRDVAPTDLRGYTQCHFFAGIATWSYALRLAGWSDDRRVWTGSCPCQSFSQAGARKGFADERHLWPAWHHLIRVCRPPVIFGEQVASKDALRWLDLVQDDLEGEGYTVGAADLCAASVGAPHIRQRLWFVAHSGEFRHVEPKGCREDVRPEIPASGEVWEQRVWNEPSAGNRNTSTLADALPTGWAEGRPIPRSGSAPRSGEFDILGDTLCAGLARWSRQSRDDGAEQPTLERAGSAVGGFWADADWLYCRDGKYRPARPGSFPLAVRPASRVGRLRAYGNTIVAPLAAEFVRAYTEVRGPVHD